MSKYIVTIFHETYTDYIVEAENEGEAQDLAMMGEYDEIDDVLRELMKKAGDAAKKHKVRLSVHPGQYTVLGSNNADVVKKSIVDLQYHAH